MASKVKDDGFTPYTGAVPAADVSSPISPTSPTSPTTLGFDFKVMIVRAKVYHCICPAPPVTYEPSRALTPFVVVSPAGSVHSAGPRALRCHLLRLRATRSGQHFLPLPSSHLHYPLSPLPPSLRSAAGRARCSYRCSLQVQVDHQAGPVARVVRVRSP